MDFNLSCAACLKPSTCKLPITQGGPCRSIGVPGQDHDGGEGAKSGHPPMLVVAKTSVYADC